MAKDKKHYEDLIETLENKLKTEGGSLTDAEIVNIQGKINDIKRFLKQEGKATKLPKGEEIKQEVLEEILEERKSADEIAKRTLSAREQAEYERRVMERIKEELCKKRAGEK